MLDNKLCQNLTQRYNNIICERVGRKIKKHKCCKRSKDYYQWQTEDAFSSSGPVFAKAASLYWKDVKLQTRLVCNHSP